MSSSKEDVLRGLHASKYYKVISVHKGEIYDVVVDVRKNSPTYLKWSATVLSAESKLTVVLNQSKFFKTFLLDKKQIMVPSGCAHGFFCMKEAIISYLQGGTFHTSQEQVKIILKNFS